MNLIIGPQSPPPIPANETGTREKARPGPSQQPSVTRDDGAQEGPTETIHDDIDGASEDERREVLGRVSALLDTDGKFPQQLREVDTLIGCVQNRLNRVHKKIGEVQDIRLGMERHFFRTKHDQRLLDGWEPPSDSDREEVDHEEGHHEESAWPQSSPNNSGQQHWEHAMGMPRGGEEAARHGRKPLNNRARSYHALQVAALQELQRLDEEGNDQKEHEGDIMGSSTSIRLGKRPAKDCHENMRGKRSRRMVA